MKTLKELINQISTLLTPISSTPRLDAELLVAKVVQHSRSWLFANFDHSLTAEQLQNLNQSVARRVHGEPMAYILGYQEFWGLKLKVNADVLVPRPETEHIVEWILSRYTDDQALSIAELGTGSGAIALALAFERPSWILDATDISENALAIAKQNAAELQVPNINFYLGHWCQALPTRKYALIISNPPYIAENDPHLLALKHEPKTALCAGIDGLDAIREIIAQTPDHLTSAGYLILEHGFDQANAVMKILRQYNFTDIQDHRDLAGQPRFATARYTY